MDDHQKILAENRDLAVRAQAMDVENQSLRAIIASCADAIDKTHRALGAPGDYGYGTKEGDALFALYQLRPILREAME